MIPLGLKRKQVTQPKKCRGEAPAVLQRRISGIEPQKSLVLFSGEGYSVCLLYLALQ